MDTAVNIISAWPAPVTRAGRTRGTSAADDPSVSQCNPNAKIIRYRLTIPPVPYDVCVGVPISYLLTAG